MTNASEHPILTLSPEALTAAQRFQEEHPEWKSQHLRVYLAGKGCDGFNYGVAFDTKILEDIEITCGTMTILVDEKTLPFVRGSTINWIDDERGKGFLVENPQHQRFRGKFYQRPDWHKKVYGEAKS